MSLEMQAFAQENGYLALLAHEQLVYCEAKAFVLDLSEVPGKFKDYDDGLISMKLLIQLVMQTFQSLAIPLTYWKHAQLPQEAHRREQNEDVYALEVAGLKSCLCQQISIAFKYHTLSDLERCSCEEVQSFVNLSLSHADGAYEIKAVQAPQFQAVSRIQELEYQATLRQVRREQELENQRAAAKQEAYLQQQTTQNLLQLEKMNLERKLQSLEHASQMETVQREQAKAELKCKQAELSELEFNVEQARKKILQLETNVKLNTQFEQQLQACRKQIEAEQKAQETLSSNLATILDGLDIVRDELAFSSTSLSKSAASLALLPTEFRQAIKMANSLVERMQEQSCNPSGLTKQQQLDAFQAMLQAEFTNQREALKEMVITIVSENVKEMKQPLQVLGNRLGLLDTLRTSIRSNLLERKPQLGIAISLADGKRIQVNAMPASARAVTFSQAPLEVGSTYKLEIDFPQDGYLWLFHFGRKYGELPHLLYPFIDVRTCIAKSQQLCRRGTSLLFPDDIVQEDCDLEEVKTSGEDAQARDIYAAVLCSEKVKLLSAQGSSDSFGVTVAEGPGDDNCAVLYLRTSLLQPERAILSGCGMLEYRVK